MEEEAGQEAPACSRPHCRLGAPGLRSPPSCPLTRPWTRPSAPVSGTGGDTIFWVMSPASSTRGSAHVPPLGAG